MTAPERQMAFCMTCWGTGEVPYTDADPVSRPVTDPEDCPACGGTGMVPA